MKEPEKTAVSRDGLTDIVRALEAMQRSLLKLHTSLAGIIPATPDDNQLTAICGNTLATLFPGVPYHIYIDTGSPTTISRLLLILPHLAPTLLSAGTITRIDIHAVTLSATFNYHYRPHLSIPALLIEEYTSLPLYASVSTENRSLTVTLKK